MKYSNCRRKTKNDKAKNDKAKNDKAKNDSDMRKLAMMYVNSDSYDEFKVKSDLEAADASIWLKFGCWIHWMSKEHPFLWFMMKAAVLSVGPVSLVLCSIWSESPIVNVFFVISVFAMLAAIFTYYLLLFPVIDWITLLERVLERNAEKRDNA